MNEYLHKYSAVVAVEIGLWLRVVVSSPARNIYEFHFFSTTVSCATQKSHRTMQIFQLKQIFLFSFRHIKTMSRKLFFSFFRLFAFSFRKNSLMWLLRDEKENEKTVRYEKFHKKLFLPLLSNFGRNKII